MKFIKIFFLSLLSVIVFALISYQFDEELNPEIVAILNYQSTTIPVESNAYFHVLGLFTSKDKVPHVIGQEIIAKAKSIFTDESKQVNSVFISDIKDIIRIPPVLIKESICSFNKTSCLYDAKKNREAFLNTVNTNGYLLTRYRESFNYTSFQETQFLFGFDYLLIMHRLFLTEVTLLWLADEKEKALDYIHKDMKFWSMVTHSDISLITRMITTAILIQDVNLLSELVSDCKECDGVFSNISDLLLPIEQQEKSLRKIFRYEFLQFGRFVSENINLERNKGVGNSFLFLLFYKKQALQNKIYASYKITIDDSECPIATYIKCHEKYLNLINQNFSYFSRSFLSDPMGTILSEISKPTYSSYAWQGFRLEAMRRLILVKHQIYLRKIKSSDIKLYLSNLPIELQSPFLDTQIEWNVEKNTLIINPGKIINDVVSISI